MASSPVRRCSSASVRAIAPRSPFSRPRPASARPPWSRRGRPSSAAVAWVSLDRRDQDPARFWTHVIAALAATEPRAGTTSLPAVKAHPDEIEKYALPQLLEELLRDGPRLARRPGRLSPRRDRSDQRHRRGLPALSAGPHPAGDLDPLGPGPGGGTSEGLGRAGGAAGRRPPVRRPGAGGVPGGNGRGGALGAGAAVSGRAHRRLAGSAPAAGPADPRPGPGRVPRVAHRGQPAGRGLPRHRCARPPPARGPRVRVAGLGPGTDERRPLRCGGRHTGVRRDPRRPRAVQPVHVGRRHRRVVPAAPAVRRSAPPRARPHPTRARARPPPACRALVRGDRRPGDGHRPRHRVEGPRRGHPPGGCPGLAPGQRRTLGNRPWLVVRAVVARGTGEPRARVHPRHGGQPSRTTWTSPSSGSTSRAPVPPTWWGPWACRWAIAPTSSGRSSGSTTSTAPRPRPVERSCPPRRRTGKGSPSQGSVRRSTCAASTRWPAGPC